MEAKKGKDLLILFGQWMFIESKTDTKASTNTLLFRHSKASTNTLLFRWWAETKRSFVFEELQPIQDF